MVLSGKGTFSASTTTRAGLNLGGTGVAPTSPVDGDLWRIADQAYIRMGANTREVLLSGPNQTIGGLKTFQGVVTLATPSAGTVSLAFPAGTTTATTEGQTWNDSGRRALMTRINSLNQEVTTCMWQGVNHTAVLGGTYASLLAGGASAGTLTLPANTLTAGRIVRITMMLSAADANVAAGLEIRISLGGTVVGRFVSTRNSIGQTTPVKATFMLSAHAAPGASVTVSCWGTADYFEGGATGDIMATSSANVATNASLAMLVEGLNSNSLASIVARLSSIELL